MYQRKHCTKLRMKPFRALGPFKRHLTITLCFGFKSAHLAFNEYSKISLTTQVNLLVNPYSQPREKKVVRQGKYSKVKWIEFPDSGARRGNGEGDAEAAEELLKRGRSHRSLFLNTKDFFSNFPCNQ